MSSMLDIKENNLPQNGRDVLIQFKDKLEKIDAEFGFYANFQMIDANEGSECFDQIGGHKYLQEGWYKYVLNNPKRDCEKLKDVEILAYKIVDYEDYEEACIVSGASQMQQSENWMEHYKLIHSDRENWDC